MKKHWIITKEPLFGSSTSNIIRLLFENKFRVHPKYVLRLFFALFISILFMPFRMIERIFFYKKIRKTEIKEDPIFHYWIMEKWINLPEYFIRKKWKLWVSPLFRYFLHNSFFSSFSKFGK